MSTHFSAHQSGKPIRISVDLYTDPQTPGAVVTLQMDGDLIAIHVDSLEDAAELALAIAQGTEAAQDLARERVRKPSSTLEEVPLVF